MRHEYRSVVTNDPVRHIERAAQNHWRLVAVVRLADPVRELYFERPLDNAAAMVDALTRESAPAAAAMVMH